MKKAIIIKKNIKNMKKRFKSVEIKLVKYYGVDTAEQIIITALEEYRLLLSQTPRFPGKFNVFNFIIKENALIVALYKAMKRSNKTVQETIRIFYEVLEDKHNSIPKFVRQIAKQILFSRIFLLLMKSSAERTKNHPDGWKIKYSKGESESCNWYFECVECGVIKYYLSHNAEELSKYCNFVDYIQSQYFDMGMRNTKNIGQGDNVCCSRMKKNRQTVVPDNLLEIISLELTSHSSRPSSPSSGSSGD